MDLWQSYPLSSHEHCIVMSKEIRRAEGVESDSSDSETVELSLRKRSEVLSKAKGMGHSSKRKALRKREMYTEEQMEYLTEQHTKLEGKWKLIGKSFRDKFPSKAHVTDKQLNWVLRGRRSRQGTNLDKDPEPVPGGRKYSLEEYEFLVRMRSNDRDWKTITRSFYDEFTDKAGATESQLKSIFHRLCVGGPHIPADLQKRAAACKGKLVNTPDSEKVEPKVLKRMLNEVDLDRDGSYSKTEKKFIVRKRAAGHTWSAVVQMFPDEFPGSSNPTRQKLNGVYKRFERRQTKDMQRLDHENSGTSETKRKEFGRAYTTFEKDWLVAERAKGDQSWEEIARSFRDKFPRQANVTWKQLSAVHRNNLERLGKG